jgi:hypothetical protein
MKHENSESKKKVTLDTNCLIDLQEEDGDIKEDRDNKERYDAVKEIIDLHEQGVIDVKVTTRVEFDQRNYRNEERKENLLNFVQEMGIIPSVFRYDISKYGSISDHSGDGYGSIESVRMEQRLKEIMFSGIEFDEFNDRTKNRIADVDHLLAHIKKERDFFITSNTKDFIKNRKREQLKSEFGVEILTPEEFVRNVIQAGFL